MKAFIPPASSRKTRYVIVAAAIALGAMLYFCDWARVVVYVMATRWSNVAAPAGLDLGAYRAEIEAQPIAGLTRNTSGLSFNPATRTLFAVINRPAEVVELSMSGKLLRRIPLSSTGDPEGISHVAGDLFVLSDESDNSLHWVRIAAGAQTATPVRITHPALGFKRRHNLGLEGASWDEARSELWLVNERWPQRVMAVRSLTPGDAAEPPQTTVDEWRPEGWLGALGADWAGLTTVPETGNLLLLSEASAIVVEYSRAGALLGVLPLWRGTGGLARTVPQPEGIALGPDGSIYVVSEPNLFYRFVRSGRSGEHPGQRPTL